MPTYMCVYIYASFAANSVQEICPCSRSLMKLEETLTDLWGAWVAEGGPANTSEHLMSFRFLQRVVAPALAKKGFAMPSFRSFAEVLTSGLEPLPTKSFGPRESLGTACSFAHLLHLLWVPVLEYMDACGHEAAPEWTEQLDMHQSVVLGEMTGLVPGADTPMDIDSWVMYIQAALKRHLQVEVPEALILTAMSPVVPWQVHPTRATALHLLRSEHCKKLVGPALAAQVSRLILQEVADVPVDLPSPDELALKVRQELVASLHRQSCGPSDLEAPARPAKKSRTQSARDETMGTKTKQVLYMLKNRLAVTRLHSTIESTCQLLEDVTSDPATGNSFRQILDEMTSEQSIRRHLLFLDGAVDRCTADALFLQRESGSFAGVAAATDESPPSQPRFRGLRFQITVFYIGTFKDLSQWDSCEDPPIIKSTCLADIAHCPGKKGADVSRVLEKQLQRLGLNHGDVVSGTGDGGGENEGHQGVHAYFEDLNPGYVRRRCLPHIAWRTCDQAIGASGLSYKALAAHLVEGITWHRLRELATRKVLEGGLGLFGDSSRKCKEVFGQSPCAIVDGRPETDLRFLRLLAGKEHILHQLATKDLEQRALNADTRAAILSLGDMENRISRRVLQELLERCQFLYYWNGKHGSVVAAQTSWDELMQRAVAMILSLEITPKVLERFLLTEADLETLAARPTTWVYLAVWQAVGEEGLVAERMVESLDFHRKVADTAASHLNLLCDNTFRTPWLAAKILSKDPVLARGAAKSLAKHLATTRPGNRSCFEEHLVDQVDLCRSLENFANADPPTLVWHDHGRYECLFRFMAPRFLLAPDHVLDAERVHARWQWMCTSKRAQLLPPLNASLRLMHHMEHNGTFPSDEELLPNLHAEALQHRLSLDALEDADVAPGWRHLGTCEH